MSIWDELRYFESSEFKYPDKMDAGFLRQLDELRARVGLPLRVTSDHREHSDMRSIYGLNENDWPDSPHRRGAVDVQPIPNTRETRVLVAAHALNMWLDGRWPRIGVEVATSHVHLDSDTVLRRPHVWSGVSR